MENYLCFKTYRDYHSPTQDLNSIEKVLHLKIAFQETAQEYFLSSKFDNVLSTFFVDHLDGKLALFQNLQRLSQSYAGPHFIWESPSPDWMSLFMKLLKSILMFEHKIWRIKCFFRRPPRRKIISVSKPTGIITVLRRLSTQLKKSFTRLNITFHETEQEYFKFWAQNLTY